MVELFLMPFESDERIALEKLIRIELANRYARFKEN